MNVTYQTKNVKLTSILKKRCQQELEKLNKLIHLTDSDQITIKLSARSHAGLVKGTVVLCLKDRNQTIIKTTTKEKNLVGAIKVLIHEIKTEISDNKWRSIRKRHSQAKTTDDVAINFDFKWS